MANNKTKSKSVPLTDEQRAIRNKIRRGVLPRYYFTKTIDNQGKEVLEYPLRTVSTLHTLTK